MNSAFQPSFKVQLLDVDALACLFASISNSVVQGHIGGCRVHPSVISSPWVGGTLDLERAYKQVPLHPDSRRFCVIGFPVGGVWHFFTSEVLPFGASASVYSFVRLSRALHHVFLKFLSSASTVYFDDFPVIEPAAGAAALKHAIAATLGILGWKFDDAGPKALSFEESFAALGVMDTLPLGCPF